MKRTDGRSVVDLKRVGTSVLALLGAMALAETAAAVNVTIEMATPADDQAVSIEDRQVMRRSPFGGWDLTLWPFALRVDNAAILDYVSASQALEAKSMNAAGGAGRVDELLDNTFGGGVKAEDLTAFSFTRPGSAVVDLAPGPHTIAPFDLSFKVEADGSLSTTDARLRVDAKQRVVKVLCYPVTVKPLEANRSATRTLRLSYGTSGLLSGLDTVFAEYDKASMQAAGAAKKLGIRRVTLYLPPSAAGTGYELNGVKFDVDAAGRVKLAAAAAARCADGRTLFLTAPGAQPLTTAAVNAIGVSWFGGPGEVRLSCGSESLTVNPGVKLVKGVEADAKEAVPSGSSRNCREGSGMLMAPAGGSPTVQIAGMSVRFPNSDERWPHRHVICDLAGGAGWAVETMPLESKPGADWSCRITSVAGKATVPASLKVAIEPMVGGAAVGEVALKGAAGGVFSGTLPSKPGLWRLRVTDDSPLKGQTLGVALIADKGSAAVSLFTVNNRALFRYGDKFDLIWVARRKGDAGAAEWSVRLRGVGLDAVVGRIALPAASGNAGDANGRLLIDTAALAAGEYTAAVEGDGVAGYPFRFRICQREPLSDFEVASQIGMVNGTEAPIFPGSPVNSSGAVGGPAVAPYLGDGDGALDGVFGAYANASLGPLPEMFARPGGEERLGMAAAALGVDWITGVPTAHSGEDMNPKHALPENLAWVRRRMALYAQTHADYPGPVGFDYSWRPGYGRNYTEDMICLDGWQEEANRQAVAWAWKSTQKWWKEEIVPRYAHLKPIRTARPEKWPKEMEDIPGLTLEQMNWVNSNMMQWWDRIMSWSRDEWFVDLKELLPDLQGFATYDSPSLGGGIQYWKWHGLSHRATVDFSEHMMSPFDGWRAPAIMAMDNREHQKIRLNVDSHGWRSQDIPSLFAAAGRGADAYMLKEISDAALEKLGIGRVFQQFGTWFVSFDPLPDVALFPTRDGNAVRTAIYDLARLRRPAIMVGPYDVLAGDLLKYKVLLLLGQKNDYPPEILEAFRAFESKGGVILKDDACDKDVPGRSIGLAYTGNNLGGSWGGAQAGGEYEHTWVYKIFLDKQPTLVKAFADTPQPPVTTPDTDVLISPLAGKDSIICFVIDKTEFPLEIGASAGNERWRQGYVLPKVGELQVEKGWYVHNLLTGKAAPMENTGKGIRVPLELNRAEGEIYLLTRRKPENMVMQVDRVSPITARLTGGLVDGQGKPLADPMPFEVTLKGPDGATLFHKFASIGPDHPLDVPVPAMSAGAKAELAIRDLVLGTSATQTLEPAAPAVASVRQTPDIIGGEKKVLAFFSSERKSKGPVTIVLDQGQDAYRPAAEKLAARLKQGGREARVIDFDPADVRSYCLRWYPYPEDIEVVRTVTNDFAWAWRVDMNPWACATRDKFGKIARMDYTNSAVGYAEGGPRLRHDADVIMFGLPSDNRVVADVAPWLRRKPSDSYPVQGGFFVHYLWSPFRAGYDAVYVGCRDVAGAEAAVACIAGMKAPEPVQLAKPADKPLTIRGGPTVPREDVGADMGGTTILNVEYSPSGKRMVATTYSAGEWLFALDTDGKVVEHVMPPITAWWPSWYRWGRGVTPLSDTLMRIWHWDGGYEYEFGKGWTKKGIKGGGVEDKEAGRAFLGGPDRLLALDPQGKVLWTYEDGALSPDLTKVREVQPRALSSDKRVLLVSAFARGRNAVEVPSVIGLDAATGKVLWNRNGIPLLNGKIITLGDRFMIVADDSSVHELVAQSGLSGSAMSALTGSPDWVLEVPGQRLLIVENSHFTRSGPACRMYFRPLAGGVDQDLSVPGRVSALALAADKQSFVVATRSKRLLRFSMDGTRLWQTAAPWSVLLRFSPDGTTVVAAGVDGVLRLYDAANGKLKCETDLNVYNKITADAYVKQPRMGELPVDVGSTPQPPPPEPSYLKSLPRTALTFGPNLASPETMQALLTPAGDVKIVGEKPGYLGRLADAVQLPAIPVKAGTTYLVELLDVAGMPLDNVSLLRLEIAVKGTQKARNLPCTARLPVDSLLKRRRFAFRADSDDQVTLTLRPIMPVVQGEKDKAKIMSFDKVEISKVPIIIGDVVVSAMQFPGKNILFDGGPGTKPQPFGTFECTLYPKDDGVSATVEITVKKPEVGLRIVNGLIANTRTDWDRISQRAEGLLAYADAGMSFRTGTELSAVVVYEDLTGPVLLQGSVRERAATRYAVEVHKVRGNWVRIGTVLDNTQLVNIFPCPDGEIDGLRYVWAGVYDDERGRTDGFVRNAQIEAYMSGGAVDVKEVLDVKKDGGLDLEM